MKAMRRSGDFKRCSGFIEVNATRNDSYREVSEKAAECLHLTPKLNESLALFKMNGTRILDKDVCVNVFTKL